MRRGYWGLSSGLHSIRRRKRRQPCCLPVTSVEAGIKLGWEHYVGLEGMVIGMEGFGASAPVSVLYEKFGITAEHVAQAAEELLRKG